MPPLKNLIRNNMRRLVGASIASSILLSTLPSYAQGVWSDYAGNAQHTGISTVASQSLNQIQWQTPVDLQPQYRGDALLVHYGSPLVSSGNTVLVPVKTGTNDGFRVEARNGTDGSLLWQFDSDYNLPPHGWTPSYSPTLTSSGRIYMAGAGGTLYYRDNVDAAGSVTPTQVSFFGDANYAANKAAFNNSVQICTPLTSDAQGNVYFGYHANGDNPLNLQSGIARIAADGTATFTTVATLTGGQEQEIVTNCAPAISNDGKTVYIATGNGAEFGQGSLVAIDSTTMQAKAHVRLKDPVSGFDAILSTDGTASPTIGTDGHVYYGVLENPFNSSKGWMLQFDADLSSLLTPGAFGWDDTASLVPASMVPSYQGTSQYLLMTKYNNYAQLGGDGINKLAILDPNATQIDARTGATVMKEILTIAGVTPDPGLGPNAVREWCINAAVVDPLTGSILVNSEDGKLYRWDLATNTFTESIALTSGIGEAYTPTLIGQNGAVYAINNAVLFSIGSTASAAPEPGALILFLSGGALLLRRRRR